MRGYVLISVFSTDDRGCEDRVRGCQARSDGEGREEIQPRDEGEDECRRDEPALRMNSVSGGFWRQGGALTQIMTGPRRKNRLCQCRRMYALGSSTPMAKTPMARTTRVSSRVMMLTVSSGGENRHGEIRIVETHGGG